MWGQENGEVTEDFAAFETPAMDPAGSSTAWKPDANGSLWLGSILPSRICNNLSRNIWSPSSRNAPSAAGSHVQPKNSKSAAPGPQPHHMTDSTRAPERCGLVAMGGNGLRLLSHSGTPSRPSSTPQQRGGPQERTTAGAVQVICGS